MDQGKHPTDSLESMLKMDRLVRQSPKHLQKALKSWEAATTHFERVCEHLEAHPDEPLTNKNASILIDSMAKMLTDWMSIQAMILQQNLLEDLTTPVGGPEPPDTVGDGSG